VLAAPPELGTARGEWLVIDPKPMSGDPHYELAPMLWNRYDELSGDVRDGLRRRFHTLVDAAGLDEDRARDWVIVRMVLNANWSVEDAQRAGRALDAEEQEWITRCIAIGKAVQD
jgi:streptomycin 6-kinase